MKHSKSIILNDFMSSIVVFFVALPLCMGIALASGVPAEYGLISGIIGGLVVGLLSGAPLQVSGPAAGLAVMVFEMVKEYGLVSLFPLGIVVGLTQIVSSYFKLGIFFRATSPSLIKGLLGGIGVLIFSSQFHVMLDDSTKSSGLENLATIPNAFNMVFNDLVSQEIHFAAVLGIITITTIVIWNLLKDKSKATRIIPAPLIAVVVATVLANAYHFPVKLIQLPENLLGNISLENFLGSFSIFSVTFLIKSLGIAFVASAETLLCVTAVDKMVKNGGSNYNKELMAQGVGNMLAGFVGALPITGVIVRSAANVEAGGKTRMAAILHGAWLVALVLFFPFILNLIPMSALAAILVFTGWKLFDVKSIPGLYKRSKGEFAIYFVTIVTIVSVDLLTGVLAGFVLSVFILVKGLLDFELQQKDEGNIHHLYIKGRLSFLCIPKLVDKLNYFKPEHGEIHLNLKDVEYMDHAIDEHLEHWKESMESQGQKVRIVS